MHMTTLAAFLAVDLLLVFTPGADWAYAISAGLRDRSVVPAVAGLIAGYAGYTLLAVAGLVVLVASSPPVLTALTVAGAAYLMWLGWGVLSRPVALGAATETNLDAPTATKASTTVASTTVASTTVAPSAVAPSAVAPSTVVSSTAPSSTLVSSAVASSTTAASRGRIMLKGAGISGLNPKALLLYFSLFPQFINPEGGWPVAAQTGLLGILHMTACALVYLTVGVLARTVLKTRPSAARAVMRVSGAMMIVIGAFLLAERLAG
ncbi:LysE family transporter [Streptomyces sp. NPDC021749]|uniref:LysE family transporter n=1 Tax=Streptomyces sp. NPDC021749 TaxID=3154905 RepID=UPI0033FAA851